MRGFNSTARMCRIVDVVYVDIVDIVWFLLS